MTTTAQHTGIRRVAVLLSVTIVAAGAVTSPATAAEPRPSTPATSSPGAYAEPLSALGGRTLAQHLADQRKSDPRLRLR